MVTQPRKYRTVVHQLGVYACRACDQSHYPIGHCVDCGRRLHAVDGTYAVAGPGGRYRCGPGLPKGCHPRRS